MDEDGPSHRPVTRPRYCRQCGAIFGEDASACPDCGLAWADIQLQPTVAGLAALLSEFQRIHERGALGDEGYAQVRARFEPWLESVRPQHLPQPRSTPPARPLARERTPREPRAPREPILPRIATWSAARQADILLYLGAFMLSVAALIFVGYQGSTLSAPGRFALLVVYTAAFLALGLWLPRWQRVREAGAVFLALGALLTPIDAIALRTQVLGARVPAAWIWLLGAVVTTALYLALDLRGHGRLYRYPCLLAAFVGWGALGAVFRLPPAWFGAWYALLAVLLDRAIIRLPERLRGRGTLAADAIGLPALVVAQGFALLHLGHGAQLPAAYALLTAAACARLLERRGGTGELIALPILAALSAFTTAWAAFGLAAGWLGCFALTAAFGYIAIARRTDGTRGRLWDALTVGVAFGALLLTHLAVVTGTGKVALPLVYAEALAGATYLAFVEGRRAALASVPPLAAALAISAGWASGAVTLGWSGAWCALAATGYVALAERDRSAGLFWRGCAALAGVVAVVLAQFAIVGGGVATVELPLTYTILLAAVALDGRLRRDRAIGLLPLLAAQLGATAIWSAWGTRALDWYACWLAAAALGYLLLAEARPDEQEAWRQIAALVGGGALLLALAIAQNAEATRWQLPLACAIVLAGLAWDAARRRTIALIAAPALAALLADGLLWAAGVGQAWWAFPPLVTVAALEAGEPLWRERPWAADAGWPVCILATLLTPLAFVRAFDSLPGQGAVAFGMAAALLSVAAWRGVSALSRRISTWSAADRDAARTGLLLAMWAALLVAANYVNAALGLHAADRGWTVALVGAAAWGALALLGRRWPVLFASCVCAGVAGFGIAAGLAVDDHGRLALLLGLGGLAACRVAATQRRAALWLVGAAFGGLALGALWRLAGGRGDDLPLAYLLLGVVLWAALARWRDYRSDERGVSMTLLSWSGAAVALLLAFDRLAVRADALAGGNSLVRTRAWAMLAIVLAVVMAQITLEGVRVRRRPIWLLGVAGLTAALLLAIAIARPGNVQAYSLPVGAVLLALGVTWARPRDTFGVNLSDGEAVTLVGLLVLTLPAAVQGWGPNGTRYGIELIGMGALFLALGVPLGARWLVAGGVLTLSGVALRWLIVYSAALPRWLLLGAVGTGLIALGLLLLVHRERWERSRRAVAGWWRSKRGRGATLRRRLSG
jgi:hypothetical protein